MFLVYQKYDPNFVAASLDEAYLDITEVCKERCVSGAEVSYFLKGCDILQWASCNCFSHFRFSYVVSQGC